MAIAILIIVSLLLLIVTICLLFENRNTILRFVKKKQIIKLLINVFIPSSISFVLSYISLNADTYAFFDGDVTKSQTLIRILIIASIIACISQICVWIKEKNQDDLRWENEAAKYAYNGLFEIQMSKNTQLRSSYHNGLKRGIITQAEVPYNIFDQIRKITWEFGRTVSKITGVDTKNLYAAFIYRYIYPGGNDNDSKWRWITGKGSKFKHSLTDFSEIADSTFHYMGHNNIESLFYNDKSLAASEQCYVYSSRDHEHNLKGSILAAKVAFSGNDQNLCEGIIMINTYGQQFLDSSLHTEEELRMLLLDSIFPCYKKMLTTELAMLYFCHIDEVEPENPSKKALKGQRKNKWSIYKKTSKHIIAATKKIWKKN